MQVERDFINLANAKVQYNAELSKAHGVSLNCHVPQKLIQIL